MTRSPETPTVVQLRPKRKSPGKAGAEAAVSKRKRDTGRSNDATLKEYQGFVKTEHKLFQLDTVLHCARQKLDNWDGMNITDERERFYALFDLSRDLRAHYRIWCQPIQLGYGQGSLQLASQGQCFSESRPF